MSDEIRQQIVALRALDCDKAADTLEKLLAVYEAAEAYFDSVGFAAGGYGLNLRSALDAVQTKPNSPLTAEDNQESGKSVSADSGWLYHVHYMDRKGNSWVELSEYKRLKHLASTGADQVADLERENERLNADYNLLARAINDDDDLCDDDCDSHAHSDACNERNTAGAIIGRLQEKVERLTVENIVMLEYLETQGLSKADVELWVSMCGQTSATSTDQEVK